MTNWGYENTYFIPNGVETNNFSINNSLNDEFSVLYTGRLTKGKGADNLLEIIQYINENLDIKNIKFIICGSGPLKNLVEKTAKKYDNVQYLGFVPPKNFPSVYANSDLFLIPSKSEGMPLRLLEAQSSGLPVVGSNIPGITDVITDSNQGTLVDIGDIKGFATVIKNYQNLWTSSPKKYQHLKSSIREKTTKKYDWTITINKLEQMFIETCQ